MNPDPDPDTVLWCGTFWSPQSTYLERSYSTYVIYGSGGGIGCYPGLAGALPSPACSWYPAYKVLDEFSTIATQLEMLGMFDKFEHMWHDALQAALRQAIPEEEEN